MIQSKHKVPSTREILTDFAKSDGFFNKVITTGAFNFANVSLLDWEQATGVWAVLVYATQRSAVGVLLQKRALGKKLTTSSAPIAVTTS